jgi:hypothetical protein
MRISPEHAIAVAHPLHRLDDQGYRHSFLALKRLYDRRLSPMRQSDRGVHGAWKRTSAAVRSTDPNI